MGLKSAYRITSAALFLVAFGLSCIHAYDHAAYLIGLAVYLRTLANE